MNREQAKEIWRNMLTNLSKGEHIESRISSDMHLMHAYYDTHNEVKKLTKDKLIQFLKFRFDFLNEELKEGYAAINDKNPEEIIDSLIDLIVVAAGTLDLFEVNFNKSWYNVMIANMNKSVGIKKDRPNPLGLPDLIKNEGWIPPSHNGNHGLLENLFE